MKRYIKCRDCQAWEEEIDGSVKGVCCLLPPSPMSINHWQDGSAEVITWGPLTTYDTYGCWSGIPKGE